MATVTSDRHAARLTFQSEAILNADYLPIYRYASTVSARRILTIRACASDLIQRSERHAGWASQSG